MKLVIAASITTFFAPIVNGAAIDPAPIALGFRGDTAAGAAVAREVATPDAAPFGINIGVDLGTGNTVAWVAGQSKCDNAILGAVSASFDHKFHNANRRRLDKNQLLQRSLQPER